MIQQSELSFPDTDRGYVCPCCSQFVKVYRRPLNSSMAAVLILIYASGITGWFHVEHYLRKIGKENLRADFHKLRYWKFLEAKTGKLDNGNPRNGHYKITSLGLLFVEGKIKAKKFSIVWQVSRSSLLQYHAKTEKLGNKRGPKPKL